MFVQAEFGLMCPISVTDTSIHLIRKFASAELKDYLLPKMLSADAAMQWKGTQFMTMGPCVRRDDSLKIPYAIALRLRGRVGVGVPHRNWMLLGRQLPPPAALYRARRPPPQAGEVKRIRGQTDSIKNHPALVNRCRAEQARSRDRPGAVRCASSSALRRCDRWRRRERGWC